MRTPLQPFFAVETRPELFSYEGVYLDGALLFARCEVCNVLSLQLLKFPIKCCVRLTKVINGGGSTYTDCEGVLLLPYNHDILTASRLR